MTKSLAWRAQHAIVRGMSTSIRHKILRVAITVSAFVKVAVFVLPGVVAAALPVAIDGQALPSLAPMLERTTPAVVNIAARGAVATRPDPFFSDPFLQPFFRQLPQQRRKRDARSVGSGVIINAAQGLVVTNQHVISGAVEVAVTLRDGRTLDAKLVGSDLATDLAVLQIPSGGLTALEFADSDALRVGDFVVAIGNPFGLGQTVTSGIVSALGRGGLGLSHYENFIQTDAAINSGNSGGALVNLRGELVGINSRIVSRAGGGNIGIGFAIPTNMVHDIVTQLVEHGVVRRGLLGVASQDLAPKLAQAFGLSLERGGAVLVAVQSGSPAESAGLRPGDIVMELNGHPIRRAQELSNALGVLVVGDSVDLRILREGKEQLVSAIIAKRAPPPTARVLTLEERLPGAQFANSGVDNEAAGASQGVPVVAVESAGAAWRSGLRQGDIVIAVNRQPVQRLSELQQAVADSGQALMLKVQRGAGAVFILIQ
ncbi:MAG: Do/DeqQ family serine protease [Gammaproteobacteria bacterium]|jgi:Do/DeqQ family serine protease